MVRATIKAIEIHAESTLFSFIHAADLHLDSPLTGLERYDGAPVAAIRVAARQALENLVALAIDEGVAFVLIAGDLYDGDWRDYNTGLYFISQMARLRKAGIPVFVVSGNHDAASQLTRQLKLPDNVTHFSTHRPETALLDTLAVAVHGQGYRTKAVTDDLAAGYPEALPGLFNIGLLHTSVDGRPGHASYAPCSADTLRGKGYHYWALGHVHKREVLSEDPWIVFPGNLQGRHARELGPKGCTLVTVVDGAVSEVEHRDLDVLRWEVCEVDASGAADPAEVVTRAGDAIRGKLEPLAGQSLAVRVRIEGTCAAHRELKADPERWRNEVRAAALDVGAGRVWVEKIIIATRGEVDLTDLADRDDAIGGLIQAITALEAESGAAAALAPLVRDLRGKLPSELQNHGGPLDFDDDEVLRGALDDAKELLLARLLAAGDPA